MSETMKAVVLEKSEGDWKPGPACYHPTPVRDVPLPVPQKDQVLVKIIASAFNHRDVFLRQSLYPGFLFSTPEQPSIMGADAVGIVVSQNHPLSHKPVLLSPMIGWKSSPKGPDGPMQFGILGSVKQTQGRGTFAEYIAVDKDDVVPCPEHLASPRTKQSWAEAAAIPLGSLTAYRAVFTKAQVQKDDNVLITGIGGGVAIQALQFCTAVGAKVWVTSSSKEKIDQAVKLGAEGGVNYKDEDWTKQLASLLPKDKPLLDAVIDSGGGPAANQLARVMREGSSFVMFGSTSGKDATFGMGLVLKNIELKGSTMGSREEFKEAVKLIEDHKIHPVVHTVLDGLDNIEDGFALMKRGGQFGKIVVHVEKSGGKL